jgi:hypothetical protein
MNPFTLFAGKLLFDKKKFCPSAVQPLSIPVWDLGDTKLPSYYKLYSCGIFGRPVIEKNGGLRTHNPSPEEVGRLEAFLY